MLQKLRGYLKIMATTVKAKVFEHHIKSDASYNIKICLLREGKRKYLDTTHSVVKKTAH